jgi:hypothetical protein
MGLRERLQKVTQYFQKAATKGHELREEEARDEGAASSEGEQSHQREEQPLGGLTAEDGDREKASQQRDSDGQAQSGAAKTPTDE